MTRQKRRGLWTAGLLVAALAVGALAAYRSGLLFDSWVRPERGREHLSASVRDFSYDLGGETASALLYREVYVNGELVERRPLLESPVGEDGIPRQGEAAWRLTPTTEDTLQWELGRIWEGEHPDEGLVVHPPDGSGPFTFATTAAEALSLPWEAPYASTTRGILDEAGRTPLRENGDTLLQVCVVAPYTGSPATEPAPLPDWDTLEAAPLSELFSEYDYAAAWFLRLSAGETAMDDMTAPGTP